MESPPITSPREFFETLESRVDSSKAAGTTATFRFEIDGAGTWTVDVDDGKVTVSENGGEADCTISTSSETFMKIARGEQNPTAAYMSGRLKIRGDIGQAMKLQKLF
jgi:putative sterol carrier protein